MTATQTRPTSQLTDLVAGVRTAVDAHADWSDTAQLVAEQLRRHLPTPDVLTAEQRLGSPDGYRSHTLHVEPDGSFSIIALVWRPGQITRIHDHMTWCVFGVIQGVEHEELFDADLNLIGRSDNHVGDVSGFAPPGDIHRVHNTADDDRDLDPHLRHGRHPHRLQRPALLRLTARDRRADPLRRPRPRHLSPSTRRSSPRCCSRRPAARSRGGRRAGAPGPSPAGRPCGPGGGR